MQVFCAKHIGRIFIATLVFTAIIIGIMSLKARVPEEGGESDASPQKTHVILNHSSEKDGNSPLKMPSEADQNPPPAPDNFDPFEAPSERIVEEWERLGIIPHDNDEETEKLFSFSEDDLDSDDNKFKYLDNKGEGDQDTTNTPLSEIPQETQGEEPSQVLPTRSQSALTKPNLIQSVTLTFDNDSQPPHPKEDPDDPTSKGTGPHGGHKGGRVMNLNAIPIIRMGEKLPQDFKVIEP